MEILLLTLALMLISIGGLAIGLFFGREPIKGSCGGLNCVEGTECGACAKGRRR